VQTADLFRNPCKIKEMPDPEPKKPHHLTRCIRPQSDSSPVVVCIEFNGNHVRNFFCGEQNRSGEKVELFVNELIVLGSKLFHKA
jgi:hypothetical protein